MKHFFWIILLFLLPFCAPKENPQKGPVDLDSLANPDSLLQSTVDMTGISESAIKEASAENTEEEEDKTAPSIIALHAQTLPVSEPHEGSPGGVIADTLQIFQCEDANAKGQDNFFLHILNYRIHTLGSHPLCEVIQVQDVKKVIAYANYQRQYCDDYTSNFIDELTQHQCTQIIKLVPAQEEAEQEEAAV
ncbi:MAG: hypothetical protein OXK80_00785 [Bdellovibrionales bacterium]|nr:hypothetical protein [Bdellovibrionales bacterium]